MGKKLPKVFEPSKNGSPLGQKMDAPWANVPRFDPNDGKWAESSDNSGPMIGFWAEGWSKKDFLRLGPLLERKFQGKKPKSVVHLLLEKDAYATQ